MSRFDLPEHRFLHQEQLKGKQLKKIEPDKQDKNKAEQEPRQEESFERVFDTFEQAVEASAQEITASINKALLRAKVGSDGLLSPKSGNVHSKLDTSNLTRIIDLIPTLVNDTQIVVDVNPDTPPDVPPPPDDTEDTTITNEELYADREKYSQEFVNSLNIGLEAETFSSVLNTYFQKITINGEGVYILRSVTLTQVKDLISQIYVTEKLTTAPDYIPNPPDENGGYALTNQTTYDNRKANYYYMCYLNGISCTGHEFEDGTFNRDIARQCGLYDYQDIFANYLEDEGVQKYLQENFGITISTPPTEEYVELWDKLANLAAIGENGKNTGEYNTQNVLKYFGLALTDQQFMSFINKASYAQNENSITNNTWDIEAVKATISERYPDLTLSDEIYEWIGSNAFEFLLMNQSKLRANDLQDFVNYGNIPSWITYNSGTEFNEELLLKCCIQSMAELANIAEKLGYNPKEFVNEKIVDQVTNMYNSAINDLEATEAAGGPNCAPRMTQGNQGVPDYVLNFLWSKYGPDVTLTPDGGGNYYDIYVNNKHVGIVNELFNHQVWLSYDSQIIVDPFRKIDSYSFKNGDVIPIYKFDKKKFFNTFYTDSQLPDGQHTYFNNGINDFYQYLQDIKDTDFNAFSQIMAFLMNPIVTGQGESNSEPKDELSFWEALKAQIYANDEMYSFLYNTIADVVKAHGYTDLERLLNSKTKVDISYIYNWAMRRNGRAGFDWKNDVDRNIIIGNTVHQGATGDCWYVAFHIALAQQHPGVLQAIKDSCLDFDEDIGIYTVTIQGRVFEYSASEIMGSNELSKGDVELRVLELAARDFYGINGDNPIANGGFFEYALKLYTGRDDIGYWYGYCNEKNEFETCMDEIIEHIRSGRYISTLSVGENENLCAIEMSTGAEVYLFGNHEYAIVGADDKYIYIVNPWDSSETLKLPVETIKNNPKNFIINEVTSGMFIAHLKRANHKQSANIKENLENGSYVDENGKFNQDKYREDCARYGMDPSSIDTILNNIGDDWRLTIFYPDGTYSVITKHGTVEIGVPIVSFIGPLDDTFFSNENRLRETIPQIDALTLPDGNIDIEKLKVILPYFIDEFGIFDKEQWLVFLSHFQDGNGFDKVNFDSFISEYKDVLPNVIGIYSQIELIKLNEMLQAIRNMEQDPFLAAESMYNYIMNINNHPGRPDGSIYNEMSFWDWQDVLFNPFGSPEDYIAAINAMNSIINEAKSIGVSLDAYIHMNPTERQRRRGMLTTPIDYSIFTNPWVNFVPVEWDEGNNIYCSTPNQSSCFEAPDWFKEYLENGGTLDNYEIGLHLLEDDYTEAEEKLYLERQHYEFWIMKNGSLLADLPPTERYSIYLMDMMYFSMWLCTDAIMQGYTKDEYDWESLYEVYCDSEIKPF